MSLDKKETIAPTGTPDVRIRTQLTKRLGMSGRGNCGADTAPESSKGSGKGAQHHRSNKAGKPPTPSAPPAA